MSKEEYVLETVVNDRDIDDLEYLYQLLAEYEKHPIVKEMYRIADQIQKKKEIIKATNVKNDTSINGDVKVWNTNVTTCLLSDLVRQGYMKDYIMRVLYYGIDNDQFVSVASWPADIRDKVLNDPKITKKRTTRVSVSTTEDYRKAMEIIEEAKRAKEEFE